eukprot:TRINITY_DN3571_c0_g3_i1.p1 TRINITY_DN3571_c0_g3~~TRINITY_DN3571_c0_g3_i1.p1  ORF type:complete len:707 (+),score=192.07 TRINITY_DN3571_c0_g3_i1:49-2169(+)
MITGIRRYLSNVVNTTGRSAIRGMACVGESVVRPELAEDLNPLTVPPSTFAMRVPGKQRRYYSTPPREEKKEKKGKTRRKVTILDIMKKHQNKEPITMITCYDYPTSTIIDDVGVDLVLVGDSAGMVVHGHESTVPVSVDDIISHCRAVRRGSKRSFVIADMPFGSFEVDIKEAVHNALRMVKEGGADAVKLEGGVRMAKTAEAIVQAGVLVMGHVGLTPQTSAAMGGFRVQGKSAAAAQTLLEDAKSLQEAGCFSVVIEGVPPEVSSYLTTNLSIPTIGIGAGKDTSGQVLVLHDMIGLNPGRTPKFCKKYADVSALIKEAIQGYTDDVRSGSFPTPEYCYKMPEGELEKMKLILNLSATTKSASSGAPAPTYDKRKARHIGSDMKKIAVIGGGAMGSFIGGCLARQGSSKVWMVSDWSDHVNHISMNGLRLDSFEGGSSSVINTIRATSNVSEVLAEDGHMDMVIILVKSPNTVFAAERAAQLIHPDHGHILTLQNGVGNRESILSVIDSPDRVIQGVTAHGALLMGTGHVQHTGMGTTTLALPASSLAVQQAVGNIARILTLAGIDTSLGECAAMDSVVWGKLIINAGINPLSALFRVKNGVLAENAMCRELLAKTVMEAAEVADSKGIKLPFSNPIEMALKVAKNTGSNQSSMLCDVLRGVQTEIDAINGAVVREGLGLGVNVSTNENLVEMVNSNHRLMFA